ncbi:MAG: radical SAM protein [Gemmatimonas sp. SG8_38_2]|nr:MAG: radical SAM protein [Gemmatimonas sp. SG8_38_2]
MSPAPIRGRGTVHNPANRFERFALVRDGWRDPEDPDPHTVFLWDHSRSAVAYNDSPDVPFDASINPYRGCEHGCVYCYARPSHEYLGFSAGLDFETKILVKEGAPELLRAALSSPSWKPQTILMSGVTDPYQPVERRFAITRRCLQVLLEFRNPVAIATKSYLVTRDIDILSQLAEHNAAGVSLTLTTLDEGLARAAEPRASSPRLRLRAIARLADARIPVGVTIAPVIPGLTDHELPQIVEAAAQAGTRFAGFIMLRLPHGVAPLFETWLEQHFPNRKERVLNRIREVRGGLLYDSSYTARGRGKGVYAQHIQRLFRVACRKSGLDRAAPIMSTDAFRRLGRSGQLELLASEAAAESGSPGARFRE